MQQLCCILYGTFFLSAVKGSCSKVGLASSQARNLKGTRSSGTDGSLKSIVQLKSLSLDHWGSLQSLPLALMSLSFSTSGSEDKGIDSADIKALGVGQVDQIVPLALNPFDARSFESHFVNFVLEPNHKSSFLIIILFCLVVFILFLLSLMPFCVCGKRERSTSEDMASFWAPLHVEHPSAEAQGADSDAKMLKPDNSASQMKMQPVTEEVLVPKPACDDEGKRAAVAAAGAAAAVPTPKDAEFDSASEKEEIVEDRFESADEAAMQAEAITKHTQVDTDARQPKLGEQAGREQIVDEIF